MALDEEFSKMLFDGAVGHWVSWYLTATAHRDAADVLYQSLPPEALVPLPPDDGWVQASVDAGVRNVFVLLAALSLENLLKGEIVRRAPEAVCDGRMSDPLKKAQHDLLKLAEIAGVSIASPEEEQALRDAIEARTSWGAYPAGAVHHRGRFGPRPGFDTVAFRRLFDALFERVAASVTRDVGPHG